MIDEGTWGMIAETVAHLIQEPIGGGAFGRRLVEDGWLELRAADDATAIGALFETQGRHLADASPALDLVLGAELAEVLGRRAEDVRVVLPVGDNAGSLVPVSGVLDDDGTVEVAGVVLGELPEVSELVVPVREGAAGVALAIVPSTHLVVDAPGGFDPTLGARLVAGVARPASVIDAGDVGDVWAGAGAVARRAVGHELVGAAAVQLDLATAYVADRKQFGRAIGTFQAVRHRLADVYVALASARLALDEAWVTRDEVQAAVAKALAGEAHALAARWCLQVHGGIGFTWEHDLHRFQRRGWALDPILGSVPQLSGAIGAHLAATRSVPWVGDLAGATRA